MTGARIRTLVTVTAAVCMGIGMAARPAYAQRQEVSLDSPWYVSPGIGHFNFEGDEPLKNGYYLITRLGYDINEDWGLEISGTIAPSLKKNILYSNQIVTDAQGNQSYAKDANGNDIKVPRAYADQEDTWGAGLAIDGLYHFTRWERLDPFLTLGGGFMWYDQMTSQRNAFGAAARWGGGVMYHFNDEWGIRADARNYLAGSSGHAQVNLALDAGLIWNWGAHKAANYVAVGGPKDSDGDGLSDEEEARWKTDPFDPDTDKDGLTDGEEVYKYKTDPLNPDSDYDGLKDGAEVHQYQTDPNKRDTDNGGVADGHEVIEDHTNPLDPTDDLQLFELYIQFDYDKAIIKPEYFPKLDVIAKVLQRDPGATARIEGHADKLKKSSPIHNKKLSKERASAVLQYLVDHGAIAASRMEAFGYGFDRPKAPNDPINGNPVNRRVEVYIRKSNQAEQNTAAPMAMPKAEAAPAAVVGADKAGP